MTFKDHSLGDSSACIMEIGAPRAAGWWGPGAGAEGRMAAISHARGGSAARARAAACGMPMSTGAARPAEAG